MKNRARALFSEAVKNVNEAEEELCRPEEDVVSVLVCKKAQRATENFLRGFLLDNGVEPNNQSTLESLYRQCEKLNPNFSKVSLTNFNCLSDKLDSRSCNELTKVSSCYTTANNIDTFLREEKVLK